MNKLTLNDAATSLLHGYPSLISQTGIANVVKLYNNRTNWEKINIIIIIVIIIFSAFCNQTTHLYTVDDPVYILAEFILDDRDSYPQRFRVGATIQPACNTIYTYSGPESITCESTQQWSEDAYCIPRNKNHNILNFTI